MLPALAPCVHLHLPAPARHILNTQGALWSKLWYRNALRRQNIMDALSRLKAHLTSEVHRAINKRTKTFVGKRAKFTDR